jgi:hypothetical protein
MLIRFAVVALLSAFAGACGGSSSETPPPLRPLPPNVHYDRSATTLPGEQGAPEKPAPEASAEPGTPPQPKSKP